MTTLTHFKTIPLGAIPSIFYNHGFTENEMLNILFGLIEAWKMPGMPLEVTVEDVLSEMDLEPYATQVLIMQAGHLLTDVIHHVRSYSDVMQLVSWQVLPHSILLEILNDPEVLQPLSVGTAADGCPGDARSLFESVHADRDPSRPGLNAFRAPGLFYTSH